MFSVGFRTNSEFCLTQHPVNDFVTDMASVYCAVRTGSFNREEKFRPERIKFT